MKNIKIVIHRLVEKNFILFNIIYTHFKHRGLFSLLKVAFGILFKELLWLLMLPLIICLHLIGYRRLIVQVGHIGHLASEIDALLKENRLGKIDISRMFIACNIKRVANKHLLTYWDDYIPVYTQPLLVFFACIASRHFFLRSDLSDYISTHFGQQKIYKVNHDWGNRPPLLSLRKEDKEWGEAMLETLGIPKNSWYVCLHMREGGYLPHHEMYQSHRNVDIQNCNLAIKEIISKGGYVVRMGDVTMTPYEPLEGFIDYALHPLKSERLDLVLCAKAKFFLGCTSGLVFLSRVFGVPVAQTNMIPVEALGLSSHDISIPKLLRCKKEGRLLTFNEILGSSIGKYYYSHEYVKNEIEVIENSPEDILDITKEMLERLDSAYVENEVFQYFSNKFLSMFDDNNYSKGSSAKVSGAFLFRHKSLIL